MFHIKKIWIGHKNEKPKDFTLRVENEVEYISLSQSWHKAKEVPGKFATPLSLVFPKT